MHILIETKLVFRDYVKLIYTLTYRKPWTVVVTVIGVLSLIMSLLYFSGVKMPYKDPPYTQLFFGVFITILIPAFVYMNAKKLFASSARLQEQITYEFTADIIKATGESFKSEMNWDKVYKITELKSWFLIYQNEKTANMIFKPFLGSQVGEFRKLIRSKSFIKQNLKA